MACMFYFSSWLYIHDLKLLRNGKCLINSFLVQKNVVIFP
uniref:Uncharacterized protein n=1 Tax=Arundo donax TaxID=35708 RepID=A0A0A8ZNQ2_ARUDO